jgi:beta-lactamase class A
MPARPACAGPAWAASLERVLGSIEAASGGRLGVAVRRRSDGAVAGHRAGEMFPLCSTFKLLAAGAVLARMDAGQATLSRRIRFEAADVVPYSPITKDRVGGDGMALADLCAAALRYSDNTAGNLLLRQIGGPAGLTRYARSLGDTEIRLDRIEPALNEALPGDPRDTTTPAVMAADLATLLFGDALSAPSRSQLVAWLKGNTTGGARLRAGLPKERVVGDKTGAGERGATNDVAVIWPPDRDPLLVAVYLAGTAASASERDATIAAVGRAVTTALTG